MKRYLLLGALCALSAISSTAYAGHFGTDDEGNQVWYGTSGNWSIVYGDNEQGIGWRNRDGGFDYYMNGTECWGEEEE